MDVAVQGDQVCVRVTSGHDSDRHPVVVPAPVGADDDSVSLLLDRKSFEMAPSFKLNPDLHLDSFTVMGRADAEVGGGDGVVDGLGPGYGGPYGYPEGSDCSRGC